jgi:hypothetical protein
MDTKVCPVVLALVCIAVAPLVGQAADLCTNNNQCSGSDACIGGACAPPVPDHFAYATTAMTRWSSYVWAVQFPALFEPVAERCCFDYTGDGVADDAFGAILGLMGPLGVFDVDPDVMVEQVLENGTLVKVFDWRELAPDLVSGDVQLSVFDGEWTDPTTHADRIVGQGHVAFRRSSFGPYGALDQLNAGTVTAGLVDVTGNQFTLMLPWITGELVLVHLQEPRLEAPAAYGQSLQDGCLGLCTVDEDRGEEHIPRIVVGAKLGGIVAADEMLTHMDAFYRQCACAGVDPTSPVFVWQENTDTGVFEISCTANTGDPLSCDSADPCANLTMMCSVIPIFGNTLDVDQDGNNVPDGWSIGLRLGFSGTTLDPIPVLFYDYFESGDTTKWSSSVP